MLWATFDGLFWAVEKRVRLVFRGFWRNGSLCRRAALVLFVLGLRLPVSFLPLYLIWRDVRLGPDHRVYWRGQGRIVFLLLFFVWGALRRRGIVEKEARHVMYK
jgi:hypothetical protein